MRVLNRDLRLAIGSFNVSSAKLHLFKIALCGVLTRHRLIPPAQSSSLVLRMLDEVGQVWILAGQSRRRD